jgi:hypothetical protein
MALDATEVSIAVSGAISKVSDSTVITSALSDISGLGTVNYGYANADGVTVQQFNEGAGGQVVFHLHLHVIPRKAGVPMKPPASEKEKPEVLSDHALKLAAALKNA